MRLSLGLAAVLLTAAACTKPPKPRVFPPKETPPANATRGNMDTVRDTPTAEPGTNTGGTTGPSTDTSDAPNDPVPTATATQVSSGPPPVPPTATRTATAPGTTVATAPSIKVRAWSSGGYFDNCVWARAHGGVFTELGCTKKKPRSATECVGADPTFLPVKALPVKGTVVQKLALQFETYYPTSPSTMCNAAAGTFAYDFARGGHETWASTAGRQPHRALCRKAKLTDGTTRIKVCYEDSTDKDFSNVILVIDSVGVDIALDNLACDDASVAIDSLISCK